MVTKSLTELLLRGGWSLKSEACVQESGTKVACGWCSSGHLGRRDQRSESEELEEEMFITS